MNDPADDAPPPAPDLAPVVTTTRVRLFLVGDAEPFELLSELAGRLGYDEVHWLDADAPPAAALGPDDHLVVGHRDHRKVRAVVTAALACVGEPPGYVGLCATEKEALVVLLKLSHERVPKARLDRVRAPAGHGLGATTPDEIAIAIAAELVAARRRTR